MTRLYHDLIKDIPVSLNALDGDLKRRTGFDLLGIAARTVNAPLTRVKDLLRKSSAAVITMSSGQGVIPGFAEAICAVLRHLDMRPEIMGQMDVGGFAEAIESRADVLFASDDYRFLAVNMPMKRTVDNAWATAHGFVQALAGAVNLREDGIAGKEVLVLGLGPVGTYAVDALIRLGAKVYVREVNQARLVDFIKAWPRATPVDDLSEACRTINYILDATPAAGILAETMVRSTTIVASPGVPHGLTPKAEALLGDRLIHEPLALGVAVMAVHSVVLADAE